ncbi:universal stress protein [Botryobacter ruber]|uniref:universal stress protein n=1 Tax=Botryobacter ruber TaxID=2171629 RepID=UPI000E09F30D|nr:universal stress protein [Botryobacter ruber]
MKTILVPTDYSKEAKSALWYALDMALVCKADVVLFHAFQSPIFSPYLFDEERLKEELEQQKLEKLKCYAREAVDSFCTYFTLLSGTAVRAQVKEEVTDGGLSSLFVCLDEEKAVSVTFACKYGPTEVEINQAARVHAADVLVMGMRGAGAISQALLGSTTIAVMQESEVPVLAVPLQVRFNGLSSVVLAIDPLKLPGADTLEPLRCLAQTYHSKLAVLQMFTGKTDLEAQAGNLTAANLLATCFQHTEYQLHTSLGDDVAAGIQLFLEKQQADLLVLVPQKHTFLSRLRNKSITGKMAARTLVPLLALPLETRTAPALAQEQRISA